MTQKQVRIQGKRNPHSNDIWVDGLLLNPEDSLRIHDHSMDGFNWGYPGSGSAQAALAICLAVTQEEDLALELHPRFKRAYVCYLPLEGDFDITVDFERFIADHPDAVKWAKEWKAIRNLI